MFVPDFRLTTEIKRTVTYFEKNVRNFAVHIVYRLFVSIVFGLVLSNSLLSKTLETKQYPNQTPTMGEYNSTQEAVCAVSSSQQTKQVPSTNKATATISGSTILYIGDKTQVVGREHVFVQSNKIVQKYTGHHATALQTSTVYAEEPTETHTVKRQKNSTLHSLTTISNTPSGTQFVGRYKTTHVAVIVPHYSFAKPINYIKTGFDARLFASNPSFYLNPFIHTIRFVSLGMRGPPAYI